MEETKEHIRLLSIFHYVVGGFGYLVSLFPVIHLAMGVMFLTMPEPRSPQVIVTLKAEDAAVPENWDREADSAGHSESTGLSPEEFPMKLFGLLFTIIPAAIILGGFALSTCIIVAGKRLSQYRNRTYCLVMAGIECMLMPFGTVLGVFSIIVLTKPEARQLFGGPVAEG